MRQLTMTNYLLIRILPLIFAFLAFVYWYVTVHFSKPYEDRDRARNLSYARAISDRIDQEFRLQSTYFHALSQGLAGEAGTIDGWIKSVGFDDLPNENKRFKNIFLANQDGHLYWSTNQTKDMPQLKSKSDRPTVEVRYSEDPNYPEFYHVFPIARGQETINLIGVFDLNFLSPLCTVFNQSSPGFIVIIFPNINKFKHFECRTDKQEDQIIEKLDPDKKRALVDIKNNINDVRFREKLMHEFGIVGAQNLPLKVGFLRIDDLDSNRKIASNFALALVSLLLIACLFVVIRLFSKAISRDLTSFEKLLQKVGDEEIEIPEPSRLYEVEKHVQSIAGIFKYQEQQKIRNRILQKAFLELFSLESVDKILAKSSEIIGEQTGSKLVVFIPEEFGNIKQFAQSSVFVGLHGWVCRNKRATPTDANSMHLVNDELKNARTYEFKVSKKESVLGMFKVSFESTPSDFKLSMLHGIIFLIESTIIKHDSLNKEASVLMEIELASMVQRSFIESVKAQDTKADISYYFQASTRLGGDWFYLFESYDKESLFFLIGDVSGCGLTQGLISTAAKGAMDMIVSLIKSPTKGQIQLTPAKILHHLNSVLEKVLSKSELTMSCLCGMVSYSTGQLLISNAGHTFPIVVRRDQNNDKSSENDLLHLVKNQRSHLGQGSNEPFVDSVYTLMPDDIIFVYTDGLSDFKHIKSSVFQRIMQRKMKSLDLSQSTSAARDEMLNLFQYYTQGQVVDDDVCFLVIKVPSFGLSNIRLLQSND